MAILAEIIENECITEVVRCIPLSVLCDNWKMVRDIMQVSIVH